jgi:hypothetical protein
MILQAVQAEQASKSLSHALSASTSYKLLDMARKGLTSRHLLECRTGPERSTDA